MAEQILEYRAAESPVSCCCVSPDGLHCAIGDLDGTLRVSTCDVVQCGAELCVVCMYGNT